MTDKATTLTPGLMVIHGNRMEQLRDLLVYWLRQHPLLPLEPETILVQSTGMAQWLKQALAHESGLGIAASLRTTLPAQFLWHIYRVVLSDQAIAQHSPLDKNNLVWRLMRLLPQLLDDPVLAPVRSYLQGDEEGRRRLQVCEQIADVFDQYQVYRADWLDDWSRGVDDLRGVAQPDSQQTDTVQWQAHVWRGLLQDIGDDAMSSSRAGVHPRFIDRLTHAASAPNGLPRRLVVFGISSLPAQTLEALAAMARFSQVMLFVHNPCQYYWGDIVADKDLLLQQARRHTRRPGQPGHLDEENLHQHAHPLLASWGKQGRDYIALLETCDDPAAYRPYFEAQHQRIDLFDDMPATSLLAQLQNDILHQRPEAESRCQWQDHSVEGDESLHFHIAHGPQREVEILHDQLLNRFECDPALQPKDVIVMVPDIDHYAPHIQAVFGQFSPNDARYIPFSVADQGERGHDPFLVAVELLLHLPELRMSTTDMLALLDVPAVRDCFGIREEDVPLLQRWMDEGGIRWGLNADHRAGLGQAKGLMQNTWQFGIERMLMGYAMGDTDAFMDIQPYPEVAGLEAASLGPLVDLFAALQHAQEWLGHQGSPVEWVQRFNRLLDTFFSPVTAQDELLCHALQEAGEKWAAACAQAGFTEPLDLCVARDAWLNELEQQDDGRGFLVGGVSFCTLMPMRSIPFKIVCLMGMNDGAYPRTQQSPDFDLMADHYRPGDRSRREDDRYLLLEALLAARQAVLISWVGRSEQDDSVRPPSVLVAQLRDHVNRTRTGTGQSPVMDSLTTTHPLQPFSVRYFDGETPDLFTYAGDWAAAHHRDADGPGQEVLSEQLLDDALDYQQLLRFLRKPVPQFFAHRFKVYLDEVEQEEKDDEPFAIDALQGYKIQQQLLYAGIAAGEDGDVRTAVSNSLARLARSGELPLAPFSGLITETLTETIVSQVQAFLDTIQGWTVRDKPQRVAWDTADGLRFEDRISGIYMSSSGALQIVEPYVGEIGSRGKWKWHRLLPAWVTHVLCHAAGLSLTTTLVGSDRSLFMAPLGHEQACDQLDQWLNWWRQGMARPLPVDPVVAGAWLAGLASKPKSNVTAGQHRQQALEKAKTAYEGDGWHVSSLRDQQPTLKREYPDFDSLTANGEFMSLATDLYGLLHSHDLQAPPRRSSGG